MNIACIGASYTDSRQVFREDSRYGEALDVAIEAVERMKIDYPQIVDKVMPPIVNAANALYLPLEIAEAIYLQETKGVQAKFGPESEEFFDACIKKVQEDRGIPYCFIRKPLGPRKAAYLSDTKVIATQSQDSRVDFLLRDEDYKQYVKGYLFPFSQKKESVLDTALRMRDKLAGGTP